MTSRNETPWAVPLVGRDRAEEGRSATPLELFFDLAFVVAVATTAGELHHGLAEGHWSNLGGYLAVFFAIWWAWMSVTWFASAYDTNDVLWRVTTFVQMAGVLVLASGVPRALSEGDWDLVVAGYVAMRAPMVLQWWRVARGDPDGARTARLYAAGISVLLVLWVARGFVDDGAVGIVLFLALVAGELALPVVAERHGTTPWHPQHVVERYGLMTIIVLGEVLLATTTAITSVVSDKGPSRSLFLVVVGGLLVVFSLWWFYFKHSYADRLRDEESESPFVWAYGHYVIFAAVAAVGAGLGACIDVVESEAAVGGRAVALTVGLPVAAYLLALGFLHAKDSDSWHALLRAGVTSAIVVGVCLAGWEIGLTVIVVGLVLVAALVEYLVVDRDRAAQAVNEEKAARGESVEHD